MLATSATRPARLSETMRRVRLEKLRAKKNWPARRSQPSGRCQPCAGGASRAILSRTRAGEAPSAFTVGSGCVRSSNGQNCRLFSIHVVKMRIAYASYPSHAGPSVNNACVKSVSGFLETVADAVQGLDHLEIVVHHLELLAQPLDVAVDGAIVDI